MSYLALYRKYRSQNFDEIYGQEEIIKTLKNSLEEGKISHAYLFSGPRGTGKTSVARLLAKAINCEKGIGNICQECSNCKEITSGSSPDVIEIDAASNSGVDEVRNIIDNVKYLPVKSRFKVFIIDEVHMMSNSAFNALLKTLEEPPSHVVFILCTTEIYKVLPTIVSRCQRYEFKRIGDEDLKKLLKKILTQENISYEPQIIDDIVSLANGGARDALSLLDQVISFAGNNITSTDVENLFGIVTNKEKIELLETIKNKDQKSLVTLFENLNSKKNIDVNRFVNDLIVILKDALISYKTGREPSDIYITMAKKFFDENTLMVLLDGLFALSKDLKLSNNANLLTEMTLLKFVTDSTQKVEMTAPISQPTASKVEKLTPRETIVEKKEPQIKKEAPKDEAFTRNVTETPTTILKIVDTLDPIFQDETKPQTKKPLHVNQTGEVNHLSLDSLIELSILSNKAAKSELRSRWSLLSGYKKDPKLSPYVELLLDGVPYLLTDKFIILNYNYPEKAKLINLKSNQETLQSLLEKIVGKRLKVYAIDRKESTQLVTQYRNLEEIKKLPKIKDINANLIDFE